MKHVIMYSGGVGSFMAAKLVAKEVPVENIILLFTDTRTEDEDLYRFVEETSIALGVQLVKLCDGRNVWEVFKDVRYLGNSRVAPCTRILKQKPARDWVINNFKPDEVILYVGIDWTEIHRLEKIETNWKPYTIKAPLCEEPYITKEEIYHEILKYGIKIPRLYNMGFAHNNCGGFCVKAGQAHFKNLLLSLPERYSYHENKEEELINFLQKDVSILKRQRNNEIEKITLKKLREEIESQSDSIDLFDFGGCGCFIEEQRANYYYIQIL
ncbi:phosphoadenosine phosphosulfate reductase family protein [Bacillus sp. FJAT-27445]|uniref:phosphoadenosine phosphosulfate reductase domain-containing protein n=1 Tax=Bacillus sp. FJAT-27445 TaxID=1679166 RepID=UPI000743CB82|nr:phosphoadenosine phosphosulfate reductase family protein [Bacillus sp. FJAT-27445]